MRRTGVRTKVQKTIRKFSGKRDVLPRMAANLTRQQKQRLQNAFKRLDKDFLLDKAKLLNDSVLELWEHRKRTPNALLQRNIWATLDALGLHLDAAGYSPVFRTAGPAIFKNISLQDQDVVSLEWQLARDVFEESELTRLAIGYIEFEEVMAYAEKHRSEGFRKLRRKGFSFKQAFGEACGRPDKILDVIIHSPQAVKIIAVIVLAIVNVLAAAAGAGLIETIIGALAGALIFLITLVLVYVVSNTGC